MAHPYASKAKTGQQIANSRYADGGSVKDMVIDAAPKDTTKGPTPDNLRNKQWTDATDGYGKAPGRYKDQFIGKQKDN